MKNVTKQARKAQDLQFRTDENKKTYDRMQDLLDKLQAKIKEQKKTLDEKVTTFIKYS